jgi:small subunit ribosomal protein S21
MKGGGKMSGVKLREGESFESLLKRFRKVVTQDKILQEVKRVEFYEKPSDRRKRLLAIARRKLLRKMKK